jgi:hypothetical protein
MPDTLAKLPSNHSTIKLLRTYFPNEVEDVEDSQKHPTGLLPATALTKHHQRVDGRETCTQGMYSKPHPVKGDVGGNVLWCTTPVSHLRTTVLVVCIKRVWLESLS